MNKQPTIYIFANKPNGTLYVGVTSDLAGRIWKHKEKLVDGFSKKYGCTLLVYYELLETMEAAIVREKQIKAGSRAKKCQLIQTANPAWNDLYSDLF